jgi:hypothetical protein
VHLALSHYSMKKKSSAPFDIISNLIALLSSCFVNFLNNIFQNHEVGIPSSFGLISGLWVIAPEERLPLKTKT